jgi:hypothetical protein
MKIIGGMIVFLAFFSLSRGFTLHSFTWFLGGIFIMALPELFKMLISKGR